MLGGMFFNARRVLPPTENPVILSRNALSSLSQGIEANARYPNVMQYFYNTARRSQLDYGVFNNSALMDFYDRLGRLQIQFGTYNTSVRANEDGLSFAGISDDRGVLRLLFRLDGGAASPLIIMKDSVGQNRLIMGLDINGGEYDPFFVQYNSTQAKSVFFGKSSSPGNPLF